ncbi:hypothetical protein [Methylobacterium sp. J-076]|uniref:hypothetical protein n=1 Tax=Methylobacterium sp. J-076 TaxID=2836655 RepID=UPI001FB88866|nr:hypothetical protein [Methylobacterium sp. J-076]MCJ2014015.1 hypothetical protein [Methylobacterium sp. J-076]
MIFLAVLVLIAAGTMVVAMASRGRRPPLHMDSEFHADDTDLLIGPVGRGRVSPIDRTAEVIDIAPSGEPGEKPPSPAPAPREGGR